MSSVFYRAHQSLLSWNCSSRLCYLPGETAKIKLSEKYVVAMGRFELPTPSL